MSEDNEVILPKKRNYREIRDNSSESEGDDYAVIV